MSARGKPASRAAWDVERVTEDGMVLGWAYDAGAAAPACVRVLLKGAIVAEALACSFRADLLARGQGHGHYGFAARLRTPVRCGTAPLALSIDGRAAGGPKQVAVPKQRPVLPCSVESLLSPHESWTGADILGRPGCLPWAEHLARLGTERFIEAAYRFVLARWPSDAEISVQTRDLSKAGMTAEGLLVRLLRSRERADMPAPLIPPFHPDFLFGPAPSLSPPSLSPASLSPVSFSGLLPHTR